MDSHFSLLVEIKLESKFSLICMFLNTFESKLFLIKLKPQNIIIDFCHCVQTRKKKSLKETSPEADIKN